MVLFNFSDVIGELCFCKADIHRRLLGFDHRQLGVAVDQHIVGNVCPRPLACALQAASTRSGPDTRNIGAAISGSRMPCVTAFNRAKEAGRNRVESLP